MNSSITSFFSYTLIGEFMKKYSKYILLIMALLFLLIAFNKVNAVMMELPLSGKVIFVDPGHGGRDPGTYYRNIYEKNLNLQIGLILRDELMNKGAIVYMTRETDIDLSSKWDARKKRGDLYRRIKMMENAKAELYLSIHINWYRSSGYRGAEVLYNGINPQNRILGQVIMDGFKNDLKSKRKLVKTNLYMYRSTRILGVLIECGFLSNPNERYLLQQSSYQKKIATSITDSVVKYFTSVS